MSIERWLAFAAASTVVVMIPGPIFLPVILHAPGGNMAKGHPLTGEQ
ncbi:hypothetical protein [Marinivivus vitaminiproducens]|nr:hypothetical protein P4R82_14285 [Geminicoccaceae bacterium SCSIO 64248]